METWNGFRVVGAVEDDTITKDNDLVSALKSMLAEAYVLYHTIHGFHWNVVGNDFYQYHKFFDEIVDDIYENIDPIAENIRKLGAKTPFIMSELAGLSKIKEVGLDGNDPQTLAKQFLDMNNQYIDHIKNVFNIANKDNEQGIANFVAERIDQHQKWSWFLKASTEA
jgi:starvation-inducible DNA-binding protein